MTAECNSVTLPANQDAIPMPKSIEHSERIPAWKTTLFIFSLMPAFHMLATWDFDGNITNINQTLRLYSLPIIWLELFILTIAVRKNWSPLAQYKQLGKSLRFALLILITCGTISSLILAENSSSSILTFCKYILQIAVLGALIHILKTSKNISTNFYLKIMIFGTSLYTLLLVTFCIFVEHPLIFQWVERIPSATNVRQIGNVLGILTIFPASVILFSKKRNNLFIAVFIHTALLAFVMWSGTRGALLGYFVALLIAGASISITHTKFRATAILCSAVAALLLSLSIPTPSPYFGVIRMQQSLETDDMSSGRTKMWKEAAFAIAESPVIGHGSGTYRHNMLKRNGYPYNHPHNFILQFLYDWGLIGAICAIILLGRLGFSIFTSRSESRKIKFIAAGGFTCTVAIAMIEGTLFHPLPMALTIAMIAPLLSDKARSIMDNKSSVYGVEVGGAFQATDQ